MRLSVFDLITNHKPIAGERDLGGFVDAWRQLHHLAQAVAEVGKSWGEPRDDDSHSAFVGGDALDRFESRGEPAGIAATFGGPPLHVEVRRGDRESRETARLACEGLSVERVSAWVRDQAERLGGPPRQAAVPAPDLPDHPAASGSPLRDSDDIVAVLALYSLTRGILDRLARKLTPAAAESVHELVPRLWPHHFDLAALFVAERDDAGAMTKTIGVGLAVPDQIEPSGYWYVSPWQRGGADREIERRELPIGRWIEPGSMAVLPVADVWAVTTDNLDDAGAARTAAVSEFFAAAFNACADSLGVA